MSAFDECLALLVSEADALKAIGDRSSRVRRAVALAAKEGDLSKLGEALHRANEVVRDEAAVYARVETSLRGFDISAYLTTEFHQELTAACRAAGLTIDGAYPLYRVGPISVRVVDTRLPPSIEVGGKKMPLTRPALLAEQILAEVRLMESTSFDPPTFLTRLIAAYDENVRDHARRSQMALDGVAVPIKDVYARFSSDKLQKMQYSYRHFAYDLHRLMVSGLRETDGRRIRFEPARDRARALPVLDAKGAERLVGALAVTRSGDHA